MLSRKVFRRLCLLTALANGLGNIGLLLFYRQLFPWLGVPLPSDVYSFVCVSGFSFTIGVLSFMVFWSPEENAPLLVVGAIGKAIFAFFTFYFRVFHGLHWFNGLFGLWDGLFSVIFLLFLTQLRGADLAALNAGEVAHGAKRPPGRKALLLLFSLTGTGSSAMRRVQAGLERSGYSTQVENIVPLETDLFRFPFTVGRFVRIMLRAIFRRPAPIQALSIRPDHDFDLIVVFCQTWFVGMSAPVEAVFQDPANRPIFAGRDSAAVVVCRGLCRRSQAMLVGWLQRSGATVVGSQGCVHVGHEPSRAFSLFAYLIYGRTGMPSWLRWFLQPTYGLSEQELDGLQEFGTALGCRWNSGESFRTEAAYDLPA
jgi:hypothetical protein